MIQIKEGDPNVIQKFQRRGPRYGGWNSSRVSGGRSRKDGVTLRRLNLIKVLRIFSVIIGHLDWSVVVSLISFIVFEFL